MSFDEEMFSEIAKQAAAEDSEPAIVNPAEYCKISAAYKKVQIATDGVNGVKVTYKLHHPYKSTGRISVTGKAISFASIKDMIDAIHLADNFEVYPKTNGTIQINLGFNNLTSRIEGME